MSNDDPTAKRRPGRPKKPAADRRTIRIDARFSPNELEALEARAEAAGVATAVFIRMSALGTLEGE